MIGRIRFVLACVSAAGLMAGLTAPIVSAASVKSYSASLQSPAAVFAGAAATYTFKITNSTTSTNTLGSVQVAIPAGFSNVVLGYASGPAGAWEELKPGNCVYGSPSPCPTVVQVDTNASGGTAKLSPGQSMAFTLTATAAEQPGTYTWNTAAKPSTDFSGTSLFSLAGSQPSVTVIAAPAVSLKVGLPGGVTAGMPFSFTLTAVDQFGSIATGYLGAVHFSSSDSGGTLPTDYQFQPADAGTHTFTNGATLTTAGVQTLTGTDKANGSITGSSSLTINAAAASRLALSAPSSGTAGSSLALSVTAYDPYGNVAVGYKGTDNFSSSDHGAETKLPGAYAFLAVDAGTHAFTATLTTAGVQTLTVSDGLLSSSISVTVGPAAATNLQVSGVPVGNVTAGNLFSATVTAVDQYGNTATGYLGTVHFTSSDLGAHTSMPADYTFTSADSGVHTFIDGFLLTTAGSQSITATDTAINSTVASGSAGASVSPGAGHLVVASVTDHATGLAEPVQGQNFDVVVNSVDAYGNPAPVSQPTTVTLSIKSGTGTGTLSGTLGATVPKGSDVWIIAGAQYSKVENAVMVVASTTFGDSLPSGQVTVNVQALAAVVTGTPGTSITLFSSACVDATVALPTCATTFFQHGVNGKAFLSEGVCAGITTGCLTNSQGSTSLLMNVTANLKDASGQPLYSRNDPALTIVECDKSLCTGKGVSSYSLFIDLNNSGTYMQVPACPSKGVIAPAPAAPYCVDNITSHRDGSGDLKLYLLFAIDYGVHYG